MPQDKKPDDKIEQAPELDAEDEEILDAIWDEIGKEEPEEE